MLCTFIDLTIIEAGNAALFFALFVTFFVFVGIFLLLHAVNKLQTVPLLIQTGNHSSVLTCLTDGSAIAFEYESFKNILHEHNNAMALDQSMTFKISNI